MFCEKIKNHDRKKFRPLTGVDMKTLKLVAKDILGRRPLNEYNRFRDIENLGCEPSLHNYPLSPSQTIRLP